MTTPERGARAILDPQGRVLETESQAFDLLGVAGGERGPKQLQDRLHGLGLTPPAAGVSAAVVVADRPPVRAAYCRTDSGFTLVLSPVAPAAGLLPPGFLVTFAHELRTPLTSMRTALDLVARAMDAGNPPRRDLVEVGRQGVERLALSLTRILDQTAVLLGQLKVAAEPADPGALLADAAAAAGMRHPRARLAVAPAAEPLPPVLADRKLVLRVLAELIDNAVQCGGEGGAIEIGARTGPEQVIFTVADRGPGVPPELSESVFQPFFQVDDSLTRAVPGLGIGLSICRGIVERQGGTISIEERSAGGTVVSFTLPETHLPRKEISHGSADDPVRG